MQERTAQRRQGLWLCCMSDTVASVSGGAGGHGQGDGREATGRVRGGEAAWQAAHLGRRQVMLLAAAQGSESGALARGRLVDG